MYLNAIPATDFKVRRVAYAERDEKFGRVLVKCDEKDPERVQEIVGYRSGKRSAVIRQGEKLYRIKGCGNLSQGFNL